MLQNPETGPNFLESNKQQIRTQVQDVINPQKTDSLLRLNFSSGSYDQYAHPADNLRDEIKKVATTDVNLPNDAIPELKGAKKAQTPLLTDQLELKTDQAIKFLQETEIGFGGLSEQEKSMLLTNSNLENIRVTGIEKHWNELNGIPLFNQLLSIIKYSCDKLVTPDGALVENTDTLMRAIIGYSEFVSSKVCDNPLVKKEEKPLLRKGTIQFVADNLPLKLKDNFKELLGEKTAADLLPHTTPETVLTVDIFSGSK